MQRCRDAGNVAVAEDAEEVEESENGEIIHTKAGAIAPAFPFVSI